MAKGFTAEIVKDVDWDKKERQGKEGLTRTLVDIGHLVTAQVAQVSPYRSGRMRRSHRSRIRGRFQVNVIAWTGFTGTDYVPFVLYGTSRMAARDWPKRGVANSIGRVRQIVRSASNFRKL